jgi:hypothetical protein
MKEKYIPGEGCECSARCSCECGCDADWTPREVYELREQRDRLAEERDRLAEERDRLAEERDRLAEERDRLAEALREIDMARLDDFMGPHDMALKCVLIARESLAAVKGCSDE